MKKGFDYTELPVMKACCKTCPFKDNGDGRWQNVQLANEVVSRTTHIRYATGQKARTENRITVVKERLTITVKYIGEWDSVNL